MRAQSEGEGGPPSTQNQRNQHVSGKDEDWQDFRFDVMNYIGGISAPVHHVMEAYRFVEEKDDWEKPANAAKDWQIDWAGHREGELQGRENHRVFDSGTLTVIGQSGILLGLGRGKIWE